MSDLQALVSGLFDSNFMPHGHCFWWQPDVLWLHVVSDAVVAAAYFSIPAVLLIIRRRRPDFGHLPVLVLFAAFIFFCGLTHVLGIWTMWDPIYRFEGAIKASTAVFSVVTAVALWPMLPKILAIPDPRRLEELIEAYEIEASGRKLAEERFRMFLETAPDAVVIVDSKGVIDRVNLRCESLFGHSRSLLVGKPIEFLVPESVRETHVDRRNEYLVNPSLRPMGSGRELFGLKSDGTEFPVEISLSPRETPVGLVVAATIRDISDRVEASNRMRRLNDELALRVDDRTEELVRRVQELHRSNQELEQFADVISHDLKSPMRGIAALTEWLIEGQGENLDEEGREQLALLKERATRMHNMIDGVLNYSRETKSTVLESIDTNALVTGVIDGLAPPDGITITVGDLPSVQYSRAQLMRVFQNLIVNAIEHMGRASGSIRISATDILDHIEFRVADDGIGIAPEHHERIFRIFQTLGTRTGAEVNGLGLAIVKKIVERHGGRIYVESLPGEGATFVWTIPKPRMRYRRTSEFGDR